MQCLSQQYDTRDRPCGNTMHHMSVALRSHSLIVITLAPSYRQIVHPRTHHNGAEDTDSSTAPAPEKSKTLLHAAHLRVFLLSTFAPSLISPYGYTLISVWGGR